MKRILFLVSLATLVTSCGGGGGGSDSAIEGTWKGDLYQGVLLCNNGSGIGAGANSVIEDLELEVTGSDEIGSPVEARDGDCIFGGTRSAQGFKADAVSGCEEGLARVVFKLLDDGSAAVSYVYDLKKIHADPGILVCVPTPEGNLTR